MRSIGDNPLAQPALSARYSTRPPVFTNPPGPSVANRLQELAMHLSPTRVSRGLLTSSCLRSVFWVKTAQVGLVFLCSGADIAAQAQGKPNSTGPNIIVIVA